MKTSAEIIQEQISKMSDAEKLAIFPPLTRKNFVVRKSWYGRNQVIIFTNKKGKKITYNHDIVLDIMRPRLELMNTWKTRNYWSQSTDIPLILRYQDLMTLPEDKVKK